jgi:hypothetical protein
MQADEEPAGFLHPRYRDVVSAHAIERTMQANRYIDPGKPFTTNPPPPCEKSGHGGRLRLRKKPVVRTSELGTGTVTVEDVTRRILCWPSVERQRDHRTFDRRRHDRRAHNNATVPFAGKPAVRSLTRLPHNPQGRRQC